MSANRIRADRLPESEIPGWILLVLGFSTVTVVGACSGSAVPVVAESRPEEEPEVVVEVVVIPSEFLVDSSASRQFPKESDRATEGLESVLDLWNSYDLPRCLDQVQLVAFDRALNKSEDVVRLGKRESRRSAEGRIHVAVGKAAAAFDEPGRPRAEPRTDAGRLAAAAPTRLAWSLSWKPADSPDAIEIEIRSGALDGIPPPGLAGEAGLVIEAPVRDARPESIRGARVTTLPVRRDDAVLAGMGRFTHDGRRREFLVLMKFKF